MEGILLLDEIPGRLSPKLFDSIVAPYLARIFDVFAGAVRVYHNDTPYLHLLRRFTQLPFEVLDFSQETDITLTHAVLPGKALMGNVPPLQALARGCRTR